MLNIPKNIYLCYNNYSNTVLPLANILPIGNSYTEKKKINEFTKKYSLLNEYENIPLPGYFISHSSKKSWSSTEISWLVIDPRGVVVRISNSNFEDIMHICNISEGLIQEECIWARDDTSSQMKLLPVNSPLYQNAINNTTLIENKINIKDVDLGDKVLLENGLIGKYMGVMTLYGNLYSKDKDCKADFKSMYYKRRQVIEVDGKPGNYYYRNDIKILKVIEKSSVKLSKNDIIEKINKEIMAGTAFMLSNPNMNTSYYNISGYIKHVSLNCVEDPVMTLEEIDKNEATILFNKLLKLSDSTTLVLENSKGKFFVDYPYYFTNRASSVNINSFEVTQLEPLPETITSISLKSRFKSIYGSHRILDRVSIDDFEKFYKIVKHVKDEKFV